MTEALLGFAEDESEPMRDVPDKIITKTTFEVQIDAVFLPTWPYSP